MKTRFITKIAFALALTLGLTSCFKDLDVLPIDPSKETSEDVYKKKENYKKVLAKLYAGLAISGQKGPDGNADISGIDEGYGQYLRGLFYHQEYPTDEAVIGWGDMTIRDFHGQSWASTDSYIAAFYYRIFYQISACNEFLRESTNEKLASRGQDDEAFLAEVAAYRNEARFLRALSYYHAIDHFGNVPFVTENDKVGSFFPRQISREDLFKYVEKELTEIEDKLAEPRSNEFGRADKAAAWTLLAKLYLNAEVYTKQNRYADAVTYTEKVISSTYRLHANYAELFMADNDKTNAREEIIFPIRYDGIQTKSYGGTSFILLAAIGGDMKGIDYGLNGGWAGHRTTKALVEKFPEINDEGSSTDKRALFFTSGQKEEIEDLANFKHGYAVVKFTNRTSTGGYGSAKDFVDTDFPMFRVADVYLMHAEALIRSGKPVEGNALELLNQIRDRAYGNTSGRVNPSDITLSWILDERARELYWECHRRTDLIRFGKFSNTEYTWPWKGNVKEGKSVDAKYNLFPIPAKDLNANPNLVQNPGF